MKSKKKYSIIILVLAIMMLCSFNASAKTGFYKNSKGIRYYNQYGYLVKGTWFVNNKKYYYATSNGYLAKGLKTIDNKLYYFTSKGVCKTGWQTVKGHKYYFMKQTRAAIQNKIYKFTNGKTYYFNAKGWRTTGWIKVNGEYYYFKPTMKTGWQTFKGKRYYLITSGEKIGQKMKGFNYIDKKLYHFNETNGVLSVSTTVSANGTTYKVDSKGVCTPVVTSSGTTYAGAPSKEMLFFLQFESGSEAYNQTGGDGGCACGAYQFDYRYSLLDLIQYAYKSDPILFAEFKPFTSYTKAKLKSCTKLYTAWHTVYARNPAKFAAIQDTFAMNNYYTPAQTLLLAKGIDISKRPDVVKGSVYSYAIQQGTGTAVDAVVKAGIKNSTSNEDFLKLIYKQRQKDWSLYKARYIEECQIALDILNKK